jgi:hypothetical protein
MNSNDKYDDNAINRFNNDSLKQLELYQDQYETLKKAYTETAESNLPRRNHLRNSMNTIAKNINSLQNTQVATYNAAVQNEKQARTTLGQQLGTLGVLNMELQNSQYNMNVLKEDDINKARMADININDSKEYESQMQLFKMVSFYLVIILFFGVLGKFIPGITNITKIICLLITLIMILHIVRKLIDMYSRNSSNFDEYNFNKPIQSASTVTDSDTDSDTDTDTDTADESTNCNSSDDIINHTLSSNTSESFRSIKPYNKNNKSVLGKSKF